VADLPPPLPEAVSGGLIGPGRTPTDLALETALARGVDTSAHRSQVVTRELLDSCDLLVLVDNRHLRRLRRSVGPITTAAVHLGDLDPEPIRSRTIRDPWGQELRVYDDVFDRLDRCLAVLAEAVTAEAVTERIP